MSKALSSRTSLRFDPESGGFLYRCMSCAARSNAAWWPLDREFWDYAKGFTRCRACWKSRDRQRHRVRRQDPAIRERDRQYAADYYASLSVSELAIRLEKRRAYHNAWMREYRARRAA